MNLYRTDIVEKRIHRLLCTPAREYEGILVQRVFLEMDTGVSFELKMQDCLTQEPFPSVSSAELRNLRVVVHPETKQCIGQAIAEILISDFTPSPVVLLSNGIMLMTADVTPSSVGLRINLIGTPYSLDEMQTYWGHAKPDLGGMKMPL